MARAVKCGFRPPRRSVGYFAAIRLRDGQIQRATFWGFMKTFRHSSIRSGRRAIIVTDNAKYYHALLRKEWREDNVGDFYLDFLRLYSPECNPIERVWKYRLCRQRRRVNFAKL